MSIQLAILKSCTPEFVKIRMLKELFQITARAFDCPVPPLQGCSHAEILKRYALFTRVAAEKSMKTGCDLRETRIRLFDQACGLGRKFRKWLHIKSAQEAMELGGYLYAMLGIDFNGGSGGTIRINSCYFSTYYTDRICELISALDEGLLAGLSGGGRLSFYQRITAGQNCCLARFEAGGGGA